MAAIDTTILLQMFTEWKHARRWLELQNTWRDRGHGAHSQRTTLTLERVMKTKRQPQKRGKQQIQSDTSNLPLLANPLHWSGLLAGSETMSQILMDVRGKKGHPDGDWGDEEGKEKGTTSASEEKWGGQGCHQETRWTSPLMPSLSLLYSCSF